MFGQIFTSKTRQRIATVNVKIKLRCMCLSSAVFVCRHS